MKKLLLLLCLGLSLAASAQQHQNAKQNTKQNANPNIIIITTDGFRWQDLFKGMDDTIAQQKRFNEGDSLGLIQKYGGATMQERRQKLMPFFWKKKNTSNFLSFYSFLLLQICIVAIIL